MIKNVFCESVDHNWKQNTVFIMSLKHNWSKPTLNDIKKNIKKV